MTKTQHRSAGPTSATDRHASDSRRRPAPQRSLSFFMFDPIYRSLPLGVGLATLPHALNAQATGLELATDISVVVLAVASLLVFLVVTLVLLQLRKLVSAVNRQLAPIMDRARGAAENVEYVSAAVRRDIEKVNESVTAVTSRLKDASNHMEDRIEEFNALMVVVQGEAEDVLLDTTAALHGVRASVRTLGERATMAGPSPPPEPPSDDGAVTEPQLADESE